LRHINEQPLTHTKLFEELTMAMECQVYWYEWRI